MILGVFRYVVYCYPLCLTLQDAGQWERSVNVAARFDKLHLKSTHFAYARHMERCGDTVGALKHYELADAHTTEVTRMLHEAGERENLEAYVRAKDDKELYKWYAQYLEAEGQLVKAREYYKQAGDIYSLVRLTCSSEGIQAAAEIVDATGDKAAAFHMARQFELDGDVKAAMQFYQKSGRLNHAVRLARDIGAEVELLQLALQASKPVQLEVARFFEAKGQFDRAVPLFHRSGHITRALELCFSVGLFDDLEAIADDDLGDDTDLALLSRCADFFVSHNKFQKAVKMLIRSRRYDEAIDMCATRKIEITEAMAEAMTPARPEEAAELGESNIWPPGTTATPEGLAHAKQMRMELLMKLAKACKNQGAFHLATKKYTQAGNKVKAMHCLLRSGDTEKIVFFANISRNKEVYLLAANYLQSLAWQNDADLLQHIIDFYSKAKAYEQLSSFYEACSAVEIDEYRNYEKALAALKEALRHAEKIKTDIREAKIVSLQARISIVERFVNARRMAKVDNNAMVEQARQLLDLRDAETAIRVGDVFALLIYYFHQGRNFQQAYQLVEMMRERGIVLEPFIEQQIIDETYRGVNLAAPSKEKRRK
jgi:intraflagellar transport protein 140